MYRFRIELADTVADVEVLYESSKRLCRDYFTDKAADLSIVITEKDIEKERCFATSDVPSVQELESMALYRKLCTELASKGTVLIHGSCIAVDGNAYLFCAPSGTGKSTHTRLWRQYLGDRAVMINDDKPLLRVSNDSVMIYGTPWNGKHHLGNNMSSPLKAVCFLDRGTVNRIEMMTPEDGLAMLMRFTFRPEDPSDMIGVLSTVTKIPGLCDFWSLKCNMYQEAAEVAYTAMSSR